MLTEQRPARLPYRGFASQIRALLDFFFGPPLALSRPQYFHGRLNHLGGERTALPYGHSRSAGQ
jgi:hypothetical protein